MQPSTQPPLATSATSSRAAVGSGIGTVRRPRPAWVVCGGCRLKAAFPDRVRRPRPAWLSAHGRQVADRAGLASAGCSADAPACGQAVGSRLARTNLDFGRGSWLQGNAERMNGQAKDLSDRNTCFTFCSDERGLGLAKNLRLSSLNGRKMIEGAAVVTIFRTCFPAVSSLSLGAIRSSRPFARPTARWFWGGLVALAAMTTRSPGQIPLLPEYK